eukprot:4353416-Amphidinium_carterae.2
MAGDTNEEGNRPERHQSSNAPDSARCSDTTPAQASGSGSRNAREGATGQLASLSKKVPTLLAEEENVDQIIKMYEKI